MQEDPAITEMQMLLYVDEYETVTELGKAVKYIVSVWEENYWE
jgi:hypothetical protein